MEIQQILYRFKEKWENRGILDWDYLEVRLKLFDRRIIVGGNKN